MPGNERTWMPDVAPEIPEGWRQLGPEDSHEAEDVTLRYQLLAVRDAQAKANLDRIAADQRRINAETEVWNRILADIAADRKTLNDTRGFPLDEKLGIRRHPGSLRKIGDAWYCAPPEVIDVKVITPSMTPGTPDAGASQV